MGAETAEDRILAVLRNASLVLLVLLVAAGAAFFSFRFALGAAAGGIISIANLFWLRSILSRALVMEGRKAARYSQLRYLLRLGLTAAAIYLLIVKLDADVFGLLAGLSTVVLGILVLTAYMLSNREV